MRDREGVATPSTCRATTLRAPCDTGLLTAITRLTRLARASNRTRPANCPAQSRRHRRRRRQELGPRPPFSAAGVDPAEQVDRRLTAALGAELGAKLGVVVMVRKVSAALSVAASNVGSATRTTTMHDMNVPLVTISGLPDEAAHAMHEYWRAISARDKCPRCGVPRKHTRKVDGPIPLLEGTRSILASVWGVQPYLVARALYDVIRDELPPHWVWKVIPDARSAPLEPVGVRVRPKHCPMAHAEGYVPRRCRACGELNYPKGPLTYVVRGTLPNFPITQVRGGWFIAEQAYAARLLKTFPRKLKAEPFEVRDQTPDSVAT